ncbi:MAG: ribbon-helix-helix protein, CopG family [Holophagales bacterium]|jgi:transposase-like protein|nr:ribbon-helix-helix protein, CopG family [Holophagales bacterium]MBK9964747.1 ribbon-helix-helix protein, CopG family [Holophagales bacterium]
MATATVKATYSLDPGTICRLEEIARHWGVSKSEALRRAIRAAAAGPAAGPSEPLAALDALQRGTALTPAATKAWAAQARKERRASSARPGKSAR